MNFPTHEQWNGVADWIQHAEKPFRDNWWLLLGPAAIYLPSVYILSKWMEDRKPYQLRSFLKFWNLSMCIFSLMGTYYTVINPLNGLIQDLHQMRDVTISSGLNTFVCSLWCYSMPSAAKWVFFFNISKVFEFIDTYLIILRKRPLQLLQWYHHIITMLYCYYTNQYGHYYNSAGYIFAAMNYTVHALMYGYYALRSFDIKPPFDFVVTILQIVQMVIGLFILAFSTQCERRDWLSIGWGLGMYLSFFVLFVQLYTRRYPKPERTEKKD